MLTRITNTVRLGIKNLYQLNHIKSFHNATIAHKAQVMNDESQYVVKTDRIYKPTYTIEFDRIGEVLLYSCDPHKHLTIFLKYPYILYETAIPLSIYLWFKNPLDIAWYWNNLFIYAPSFLWIPRMWYWRSLQYKIHRLSLLRGGKILKIETTTLANDKNVYWVETYQFHPLTADFKQFDDRDNADYLTEEGQLKYELACQLDHIQELGTTVQDEVIYFMKEGIVHHPELFEAATKGYVIDTSNFVINTAHNIRAFEGHHNQ
ncbi:unnamed protein product [Paramecium primaurelia]|uniref:Uncharacterized protein n=1 Tax=Paramecium primaurelia TaxID=5886 RepID=A0A8S1N4D6_PARPR|nr:unnamed protein product [Paramecium primaurelia]